VDYGYLGLSSLGRLNRDLRSEEVVARRILCRSLWIVCYLGRRYCICHVIGATGACTGNHLAMLRGTERSLLLGGDRCVAFVPSCEAFSASYCMDGASSVCHLVRQERRLSKYDVGLRS